MAERIMRKSGEAFKADQDGTLLDFLAGIYPQSSKTSLKKMIVNGNISVNGKIARTTITGICKGDEVIYRKPEMLKNTNSPFRLVFEDECIMVIEKPPGMLTYGEAGSAGTSAYKEIKDHLERNSKGKAGVFVVHRLDREVSGLLLFARSEQVQEKLKDEWKDFTKTYQALAEGIIRKKSGVISSWLSEGPGFRVRSGNRREGAKFAETSYRVIKETDGDTLVELQLVTGRKNQIRVHLSDMGHPVVGDRRYGADATWERRIRLHAVSLKIRHPLSGEWMEFHSPLPKGFLVLKPEHEKYK